MSVPIPKKGADAPETAVELAALMQPTRFGEMTGKHLLPIAPNKPFLLRHHPQAWRISTTLEEPTFLPDVTMFVIEPGVNGVRTIGRGEQLEDAYKAALWKTQEQGWVYISALDQIPEGCLPDGVPSGSYLRELPCQHPLTKREGKRYVEAWNIPVETFDDEDQQFSFDLASYEKWLKWLVESGVVKPIKQRIADRMIARVQGHLDRSYTIPNLHPEVRQERIEAKKKIVAAYNKAKAARLTKNDGDNDPKKRRSSK